MNRRRHLAVVTALVTAVSAVLIVVFLRTSLTPIAASTQADLIDRLLRILFSIGGVVLVLCLVFLIYSMIVFRHRKGDTQDGPPETGRSWLEITWTVVPLVLVVWLSVQGALVLGQINKPEPAQEIEVKVISFQWGWRFEYPQYGVTAAELRLPVDRPVLFYLTSLDVVHAFWVPEWRVKQDAVPGMTTEMRVTPNREGAYTVLCNELCGLLHGYMLAPVRVVGRQDFDSWVSEQRR